MCTSYNPVGIIPKSIDFSDVIDNTFVQSFSAIVCKSSNLYGGLIAGLYRAHYLRYCTLTSEGLTVAKTGNETEVV